MKEIIRSHTIVLALFAAGLGSRMLAVAQTLDFGEQVVGTTSGPKQVIGCCQGGYPFGNGFTLTFIGDFLRGSSSTCRSQMFLSPG
jgi:hypothetical protein